MENGDQRLFMCSVTLCYTRSVQQCENVNFGVFQMGDTTKLLCESEKDGSVQRGHETGGLHGYGHPGLLDEYVHSV